MQKSYSKYKPSDFEWLGEIPEHWEVKRLRFLSKINPSKSEIAQLKGDTEVSFLPMELIGENSHLDLSESRELIAVYQGYTYFKEGDVLVAKITPCFENWKGGICERLENGIGFGTTELHVIRAGQILNGKYILYHSNSNAFRKIGESEMYGAAGQKRVPERFIKDYRITLPTLSEQIAIAEFLDRETAKIA